MDHRQDYRHPFLDCFTHAGGRKLAQSPELKRNILAVLIAMATNLGLARMSDACGISYDVLAWTMEYLREETLREAKTAVVNHHYGLELSKVFGGGTMSSSDGQRFPVRGTSLSGRDMIIHRGRVLSTYTHVSDQWPTYGTTIIVPTAREAHFALDEFLGNATDLPITDHATEHRHEQHAGLQDCVTAFELRCYGHIASLGVTTVAFDVSPAAVASARRRFRVPVWST